MGSVNRKSGVKPSLWTEIQLSTAGETRKIRILQITIFIEITYREVVIALACVLASTQVILLTGTMTNGLIVPIEVSSVAIQDAGITHKLTISVKQLFLIFIKDVQIEELVYQVLAGIACRCFRSIAGRDTCVSHVLPAGIHKLTCVEGLIFLHTTRISTKTGL